MSLENAVCAAEFVALIFAVHNYPVSPVLYLRELIYYVLILGFWEKLYWQGVAAVRNVALYYKPPFFLSRTSMLIMPP